MYHSDYKILDPPSESTAADRKVTDTPPRISPVGHHILQDALDLAQHSETNIDASNTCTPLPSKDERPLSPRINAQNHRTPPGILDITQRSQNKADTNKAWVPVQASKNGTKSAHDQQDTQTSSQTLSERSGKARRSRSVANLIRTPEAAPWGSTGASNRGSTVKPTWRVKNANTKEVAPCKAAEPNIHGAHRCIPPRPTPAAPATNHSRHATLEKPERDNTTNQDACHDNRRDSQQHSSDQEPVSTALDSVPLDPCPRISNASIAAMQPQHIKDFIPIDPHLHQLLSEQNELEHIHHIRHAIGAMGMRPGGPQMQQQPPQAAVGGSGAPLTAAALAAAPPGVQKQMLGEPIFPAIAKHQPEIAGKITGMMLEMDNSELLILLESDPQLKNKVDETMRVLVTCDTVAIIRSTARLHEIVSNSIATEAREIPNVSGVDDEPQTPRPIGGDTISENRLQTSAIDQPHIDAPCPYTWAERYHEDHQSREPGTHMAYERQLDQV